MERAARAVLAKSAQYSDPELEAQFLKKIPVGRMAEPVEIASLMLYLSTDAAAFITGAALIADGGATIGG